MTQPTPGRIEAAVAALQTESDLWVGCHDRLELCHSRAFGLRSTAYVEMAIFGPMLAMYNDAAEAFARLCQDGARSALAVGLTLRSVAAIYEWEEERNYHAMRSLY